jgi:3-oxoadipate enol-lactonase
MATATLPDGARIGYDEYDFSPPWETAEPVVLVHGFSKNRRFWYGWISSLAARYRVVRLDQRGHGDSSQVDRGFQMALRPFSQDLADFLDALGIQSAHFVMAEFSSTVAMDFAAAFAPRIRSLTLPGFGYNYRDAPVDTASWARLAEEQGAEAWARETNRYRLPDSAPQAMRDWYIREQGRMPGWFLAALFRWTATLDLTDSLASIKAPTLILAGGDARQGTLAHARYAEKTIPDCRLTVLEAMPFNVMSAAPERCVAETLQFINEITARGN